MDLFCTALDFSSLGDVRRRFRSAAEKELWLRRIYFRSEKQSKKNIFSFAFRSLIRNFAHGKEYCLPLTAYFKQELWN